MSLFLPNPCLLGIFLTISTYDGPQLVFHYPPKPNEYGYKATPLAQEKTYLKNTGAVETSSSSSDSDDDDSTDSEDGLEDSSSSNTRYNSSRTDSFNTHRSRDTDDNNDYLSGKALLDILDEQDRKRKRKEKRKKKLLENIMIGNTEGTLDNNSSLYNSNHTGRVRQKDEASYTTSNTNKVERVSSLTKIFGFEIDLLTELITPPKTLCNTRFEVTLDDMSFLGLPIHVYDDGKWKISNKARTKSSKRPSRKSANLDENNDERDSSDDDDNYEQGEHATEDQHRNELRKKAKEDKCPMNMFHLVFAMNPPVVEYNHRIDEMYHYIISRLTLVLRYEQHKSNFIYDESMKIMSLKEENHNLSLNDSWFKIIQESPLANIIYQTYKSVSDNDIVNVDINGKIRSFQIPIKNEFSTLPPTTVSILRGSYLSSINPLFNNSSLTEDNGLLLHFALLLLDDPEVIIRDIQAEEDSIIANFIKLIKPTESLSKLSTISGLELNQIFSFSFHLVLWRRAIAVPPLQTRNVYVVSPLAPLKNLMSDLELFKLQFQSLPSLPVFLSMLSPQSKPRLYSSLLPSRDHRELYLEALAWLIKTGYALQLHTFLWLKVTNKIKVAVDEEIEMENFKKREHKRLNNINNDSSNNNNTATSNFVDNTANNNNGNNNSINNSNGDAHNTKQKNDKNGNDGNPLLTDNLVNSTSHEIATKDHKAVENLQKSEKKKIVVVEEEDTILLDPERATALERRWISKIIEGKPPELTSLFYRVLKYFNGKDSLEMLPVQENISRTDIKRLLSSIDEYVVSVKHW